jgi:hypothetical protein
MASMFRTLTLLIAFILIATGGYFLFVTSEAPNFFLFGDLQKNAILLFLAGGCLIIIWVIAWLMSRNTQEL